MTGEAKAELQRIKQEIDSSRKITRKHIKNIEKKQNGWFNFMKVLLKLRIDVLITKYYYKFLNIGSKIEALVAAYNSTTDETKRKQYYAKAVALKQEYSNLAPQVIAANRMYETVKFSKEMIKRMRSWMDKDFSEMRKITDHDHILIQKATRIALSIDASRIMISDCLDNFLAPKAMGSGGSFNSESTPTEGGSSQLTSDEVDSGGIPWGSILGIGAGIAASLFFTQKANEETELKEEEVVQELEEQVESSYEEEERAPQPSHMFAYPTNALEMKSEEKEKEKKDPNDRVIIKKEDRKGKPPLLDIGATMNRLDRVKELVDMGIYDELISDMKRGEVSEEEFNFIKKIPRLIRGKKEEEVMQYLSNPIAQLPRYLGDLDLDSNTGMRYQWNASEKKKKVVVNNKNLKFKIHDDFLSKYPNPDQFTQRNIENYLREVKTVPDKDIKKMAIDVLNLGSAPVPPQDPQRSLSIPSGSTAGFVPYSKPTGEDGTGDHNKQEIQPKEENIKDDGTGDRSKPETKTAPTAAPPPPKPNIMKRFNSITRKSTAYERGS